MGVNSSSIEKTNMNKQQKILFVGVGNMGNPMANNLIDAGYDVCIHDLDKSKAKNLLDKGVLGRHP